MGRGEWEFRQDGDSVDVSYGWTVLATKPWMIRLAPLLNPVFVRNHRWVMQRGLEGLQRELARRQAPSSKALNDRILAGARAWQVAIERMATTETSVIVYGTRAGKPVVLKVVKREDDEWHCGDIAARFGARGVAQVYARAGSGAVRAAVARRAARGAVSRRARRGSRARPRGPARAHGATRPAGWCADR